MKRTCYNLAEVVHLYMPAHGRGRERKMAFLYPPAAPAPDEQAVLDSMEVFGLNVFDEVEREGDGGGAWGDGAGGDGAGGDGAAGDGDGDATLMRAEVAHKDVDADTRLASQLSNGHELLRTTAAAPLSSPPAAPSPAPLRRSTPLRAPGAAPAGPRPPPPLPAAPQSSSPAPELPVRPQRAPRRRYNVFKSPGAAPPPQHVLDYDDDDEHGDTDDDELSEYEKERRGERARRRLHAEPAPPPTHSPHTLSPPPPSQPPPPHADTQVPTQRTDDSIPPSQDSSGYKLARYSATAVDIESGGPEGTPPTTPSPRPVAMASPASRRAGAHRPRAEPCFDTEPPSGSVSGARAGAAADSGSAGDHHVLVPTTDESDPRAAAVPEARSSPPPPSQLQRPPEEAPSAATPRKRPRPSTATTASGDADDERPAPKRRLAAASQPSPLAALAVAGRQAGVGHDSPLQPRALRVPEGATASSMPMAGTAATVPAAGSAAPVPPAVPAAPPAAGADATRAARRPKPNPAFTFGVAGLTPGEVQHMLDSALAERAKREAAKTAKAKAKHAAQE